MKDVVLLPVALFAVVGTLACGAALWLIPIVAGIKLFGIAVPWTYGGLAFLWLAALVGSIVAALIRAAVQGVDL